jgi:prepilin-type N-terminal cleavage/methylation domain-containing protein
VRTKAQSSIKFSRRAFTLVELLVVISVLALLLSILLPSLSGGRAEAMKAVCSQNLHQIVVAMNTYGTEFEEWLPSPQTTGLARDQNFDDEDPSAVVVWDSFTPLMPMMGFPTLPTERQKRFMLSLEKPFACPANRQQSILWETGGGTVGFPSLFPAQSYGVPMSFGFAGADHAFPRAKFPFVWVGDRTFQKGVTLPESYVPRLSQVGSPARKIFMADALRYRRSTGIIDTHVHPNGRGVYTSETAWHKASREYSPSNDGQAWQYSYRHGIGLNAEQRSIESAFFDGHVENLKEPASRMADYWYPKFTQLEVTEGLGGESPDSEGFYTVR